MEEKVDDEEAKVQPKISDQVDGYRLGRDDFISRPIAMVLLRGGEDPKNTIQIRGVLDQHIR